MRELGALEDPSAKGTLVPAGVLTQHETGSPGTLGAAPAGSKDTCAEGLGMRSVTAYNLAFSTRKAERVTSRKRERERESVC